MAPLLGHAMHATMLPGMVPPGAGHPPAQAVAQPAQAVAQPAQVGPVAQPPIMGQHGGQAAATSRNLL